MAVDVVTTVDIEREREAVAAFASDPDNATTWYENIKRVEWKTTPPVAVGSRIAFVAHFLGKELAYTYEVHELDPGKRLVMRTDEGPFPMETTYEWTAVAGDATRMRLRNRGAASGFSAWLAPFMSWSIRRANRKDLGKLKGLLESQDRG